MDKREIAKFLSNKLKEKRLDDIFSLFSSELFFEKTEKFKLTKAPFLTSVGEELGKFIVDDKMSIFNLLSLWEFSYSEKRVLSFGLKKGREIRLIIIGALSVFSKKNYEETKDFISKIIHTIDDWETCDQLASRVLLNLLLIREDDIFSMFMEWVKSPKKWVRRIVVATLPSYIRAEKDKAKECLYILEKLMMEKDKDVKKAVSWALREISKKAPYEVFMFLKRWAKVKDKNTVWIIKEGMKKLQEKEKKELKTIIEG